MEKQTCDVEIQGNLFNGNGAVNWDYFVDLMSDACNSMSYETFCDMSEYEEAKHILKDFGIFADVGYVVKAFGILSRNPREAVNCGKQLYFQKGIDAMRYAKALKKTGDLYDEKYTIEHVADTDA